MGAHPEVIAAIQWASKAGPAEMLDLANTLASGNGTAQQRATALLRRLAHEQLALNSRSCQANPSIPTTTKGTP